MEEAESPGNISKSVTRQAYDADGRVIHSAAQIGTQWLVSCSSYTNTGKPLKAWGPAQTAADTTCPAAAAPVAVFENVRVISNPAGTRVISVIKTGN